MILLAACECSSHREKGPSPSFCHPVPSDCTTLQLLRVFRGATGVSVSGPEGIQGTAKLQELQSPKARFP